MIDGTGWGCQGKGGVVQVRWADRRLPREVVDPDQPRGPLGVAASHRPAATNATR